MTREIIQIGNPALKADNAYFDSFDDPKLKELIQDLNDTMLTADIIGLAAPQIGENYQIFVTEPRATEARPPEEADEFRVYVNPDIVEYSNETIVIHEGCGSVVQSQLFAPVERPKSIIVEAFDQHGKKFRLKANGLLGRVIQHEYDHLKGIEFLERVKNPRDYMHIDYYVRNIKNLAEEKQAQKTTVKEFEWI